MRPDSDAHYTRLAQQYDQFWSYSDEFIAFMSQALVRHLDLRPTDRAVDLGCGTGLFSHGMRALVPLENPMLCVDKNKDMLSKFPSSPPFHLIHQEATAFAAEPGQYDKVLIKEILHHMPDQAHHVLFSRLAQRLNPGGRLLNVLLPPTIELPLFAAAHRRYEANQPHYDDLAARLATVGFTSTVEIIGYPLQVAKERYFEMVRNRYISVLSSFSDAELTAGLAEMTATYADQDTLTFSDNYVFLTSTRAGG